MSRLFHRASAHWPRPVCHSLRLQLRESGDPGSRRSPVAGETMHTSCWEFATHRTSCLRCRASVGARPPRILQHEYTARVTNYCEAISPNLSKPKCLESFERSSCYFVDLFDGSVHLSLHPVASSGITIRKSDRSFSEVPHHTIYVDSLHRSGRIGR